MVFSCLLLHCFNPLTTFSVNTTPSAFSDSSVARIGYLLYSTLFDSSPKPLSNQIPCVFLTPWYPTHQQILLASASEDMCFKFPNLYAFKMTSLN